MVFQRVALIFDFLKIVRQILFSGVASIEFNYKVEKRRQREISDRSSGNINTRAFDRSLTVIAIYTYYIAYLVKHDNGSFEN